MFPATVRHFTLIALLSAALASCSGSGRTRNVLLISVDTLRADRLGCYGATRATSPSIDRLAAEGTLFEEAYTPRSLTLPSFTSIFTSKYPDEHGVMNNTMTLRQSDYTLAERLADNGFRTRAFISWKMLMPGRSGIEQGFAPGDYLFEPNETIMTGQAASFIEREFGRDRRDFMWVHYKRPHKPYLPPPPYDTMFDPGYTGPFDGRTGTLDRIFTDRLVLGDADRRHIEAVYDGTIRYVDDLIGTLLEALERSGQAEETLVVFTTDHGEDLYSHNHYYYHAKSVYRSSTRVAIVLRQKDVIPASRRVGAMVENVDILPTIMGYLGLSTTDDEPLHRVRGVDLSALVGAEGGPAPEGASPAREYVFSQWEDQIYTARNGEWMYVENPLGLSPEGPPPGDYAVGVGELYHVASDPDEQENVIGKHPEVATRLRDALDRWLSALEDAGPAPAAELDPERIRELRALGYIGESAHGGAPELSWLGAEAAEREVAKYAQQLADRDRDGSVDAKERKVLERALPLIRESFSRADRNSNGRIGLRERALFEKGLAEIAASTVTP